MDNNIKIIGVASGIAAGIRGSELGVWDMYYNLKNIDNSLSFDKVFYHESNFTKLEVIPDIVKLFQELHSYLLNPKTANLANTKHLFFSGDHSNGLGIWSAMANLYNKDIGLIWIDAHLDCHTPSTTPSGNVHGMPIASLLGYGNEQMLSLIKNKFKPENICYIGTRDYEDAEIEFINKHNIKAYYMKDITQSNFKNILNEAIATVSKNTQHFGISLDIDSLDPKEAPATGCYTPNGLWVDVVAKAMEGLINNNKFCGLEITEYNPLRDVDFKTRAAIFKIITNAFNLKVSNKA